MKKLLLISCLMSVQVGFGQNTPLNRSFIDNSGIPLLLGEITAPALSEAPYATWFTKEFNAYQVAPSEIKNLKEAAKAIDSVTIFMGTWCGDSKREVPRFLKVMETMGIENNKIKIVCVDKAANTYKQSPGGEQIGLNIHRVPTFIVSHNKMHNRIVESPVESLELDLQSIINNSYTPNYNCVATFDQSLNTHGIAATQKKQKFWVDQFKGNTKSPYELNTYGYVLMYAVQLPAALEVFKINQKLYPDQYFTYSNLGKVQELLGRTKEAKKSYKRALSLAPEQGWIASKIKSLEND